MSEGLERRTGQVEDDLSAADLLVSIRSAREVENTAAAHQLDLAARWADLHPPESIHTAATFTVPGAEHEEPLAGVGTPLVAEFCIAELGAVLGMSTIAAKRVVGNALELRHRLARLWAGVQCGTVPAWRARAVAEATSHSSPALTPEAAAFVDAQVAAVAGRIGPAQLDRLVAETIRRFELAAPGPISDPEDGWQHVDPRHATFDTDEVHYAGTMRLEAELDIADALDLDRALTHGAATLKALGSAASLDVRRSEALGDLARTQTALDLAGAGTHAAGGGGEARPARTSTAEVDLPVAREVVLHVHFGGAFSGDATVLTRTGRLEEGRRLVLLDHVRDWCADSRTKVTVRPVIDLDTERSTPAYEPTTRIREAVVLRDRTCVFPWCTRSARRCDLDHVVPYDDGGATSTSNLAPLCRTHHRLKTHSAWRYETTAPGTFHWTSPHGHRFTRDHTGTTAITDGAPRRPPDVPRPRRL